MADYFDRNTLIMNRSQKDIQELQELKAKWLNGTITEDEKTKWLSGMRGAYNASDVNRVSAALLYCKEILENQGFSFTENYFSHISTSWTESSFISPTDWSMYFRCIKEVNSKLHLQIQNVIDFILPNSVEELNIKTANSIEQMLYDVLYTVLVLSKKSILFSGEAYSGEF